MEKPNKKIRLSLLLIFSLYYLTGCDYSYQKQIGESYFIRCIEQRYRMDIGFGHQDGSEGFISQTVFEVYWNSKYILAKRHPEFHNNKKLTEYYIAEKVVFPERGWDYLIGPLNKADYEKKIKELNLDLDKMEHVVFDDLK